MRASSSTTILRTAARAFAPAPLPARTIAVRAAVAFRPLSSSAPLLKKSKAAATKKSQKQGKEHEEVEGGDKVRYEQSLEADADAILEKTQSKMEKSVEWAKGLVYDAVERGRGRVSPALLDGVKVEVEGMGMQNLNTVASITVKGNVLFISVWDQSHMKDVQSAVRKANIPGVSPQRVDDTSFRCPIARPTFELRQELIKSIGANIETAKNQVRKARTDGLNSLGGKGEPGTDDVQKLADKFGGMLDDSLSQLKKELA